VQEVPVSILAHPEGRALHPKASGSNNHRQVSILAHPEGRALPMAFNLGGQLFRFQSSPTPKGGRYAACQKLCTQQCGFNPRPPRRAGATWRSGHRQPDVLVSILAHPEGRALLLALRPSATRRTGFNPRPPRRAGATREWLRHGCKRNGFQSSPTPKGGRYLLTRRSVSTRKRFQSSPTPKGGRYHKYQDYLFAVIRVSILAHPEGRALRQNTN